jgi:electron transfer flavoprotein beta subunit
MRIIVCIKQVPDTNQVRLDPKTGTLIREGVPSVINPDDKNALEAAIQLRDEHGGEVIVVTMGPPQALSSMRLAIAMGADRGIILCDRAFAGADTLATSRTLAAAIRKLGDFDLIIAGRQAIDGDTAQVGPQLAEHLGIPQATFVSKVEAVGDRLRVTRHLEHGDEVITLPRPLLITAIKELNEPRYPSGARVFWVFRHNPIETWGIANLDVDPAQLGLSGSPTQVRATFVPRNERTSQIFRNAEEGTEAVLGHLTAQRLV